MGIKTIIVALGVMLSFFLNCNTNKEIKVEDKTKAQGEVVLNNIIDSVSYCFGVMMGQNFGMMEQQGMDSINIELLFSAVRSYVNKEDLLISQEDATLLMESFFRRVQQEKVSNNLIEAQIFLEENKKKEGVVTLPSGLQYIVLKEGDGPRAKTTDKVTTHYHGTTLDGKVFDSSIDRGQPATFPLDGVIKGWTEALQLMKVGAKWKIFVPPDLAYGDQGGPGGPNAMLIFEIELISLEE